MTTSFLYDKYTVDVQLHEEGHTLSIQVFDSNTATVYKKSFGPESLANKQKLYQELVEKHFTLQQSSSSAVVSLAGGLIELSLPECELPAQDAQLLLCKARFELQDKRIQELEKKLNEKEVHSVLHLGTRGTLSNNVVVWDITKLLDNRYYTLSGDQQTITILKAGSYRFSVKLLKLDGATLYPFLSINGTPFVYFYAYSGHYNDATLNFGYTVQENTTISVGCQQTHGSIYPGSELHHFINIQKL